MTKLVAPFCNFAKAPKSVQSNCDVPWSADFKKHRSSRKADSCTTTQEISRLLWDTKIIIIIIIIGSSSSSSSTTAAIQFSLGGSSPSTDKTNKNKYT